MLEFKKINEDTVNFMKNSLVESYDYYEEATCKINEMIPSENVHILNSANSCLITLAESIPEPVLVCDMGGWNGFIRSCELFDKNVEYIETDNGLINIDSLDDYLEEHDVKSLYITSLAGYTAFQPLFEVEKLCDVHDVLLIVDISGSVGCEKLSNIGDLQVSSTGSPKIVNIENGGFICNITGKLELNKHLLKSLKADNITCAGIFHEINRSSEILEKTIDMNSYFKEKIVSKDIPVIHPEHKGLNTIILSSSKSKAKKVAYNIRQHLKLDGNIISVGPSYNRIKKPCVIVEIKNLDVDSLTFEDLDELCDIVLNEFRKIECE